MPTRDRSDTLTLVLLALAAAAYVALASWHVSLWYDEAATLAAARRDLADLAAMTRNVDAVHGVYYVLMHAWTEMVGVSPFAVRLSSAIAIGVAAAGTFVLARRLADGTTAAISVAILLLLPRVTWAGIEARSSALTIALAVWVTHLFVRALDRPDRWPRWLAYAVLLGLGGWLNIFLLLLVPAHAVSALILRADRRAWVAWSVAVAVAGTATIPVVLESRAQAAQLGGVRLPVTTMVRSVGLNQWFLGATPTEGADGGGSSSGLSAADVLTPGWLPAALLLALAGWGLVVLALVPGGSSRRRRAVAVALPWLVVPTVLVLAYSVVATPVYHQRYLAYSAPALAVLMATGLRRVPGRAGTVAVGGVLVATSLVVFVSQRGETAKSAYAWSRVADVVAAQREPGDTIYYGPRTPPSGSEVRKSARLLAEAYPDSFRGLRDVTLATEAVDGGLLVGTSRPLADVVERLGDVGTLWVIRSADYPAEAASREDRLLRDAGLQQDERWVESTTVITRFVRP